MKISWNWLNQYIDTGLPVKYIAEKLTGCGLEVENLEKFSPVKGGLEGVVIGEVLTCSKHPGTDHLFLTTVNIGVGEPLHIVCGAPNVTAGQKVPVAVPGTTLFIDNKEIRIKKSKIRGEVSEGMICAEDELGLGLSHTGIMILDPSAVPGQPAKEYFHIEDDWIFEIGLTPNRADAASHIGVARDLIAVMNSSAQDNTQSREKKQLKFPDTSLFKTDNYNRKIDVIIEDSTACPRYSGLTITNVTIVESPQWLKNRLNSIGLRPINNIVDITNFILFEMGQPLHAFDADKITGDKVIIKKLPEGSTFTTLDGIERKLNKDDLMICNINAPMCIAGVFGGIDSGITGITKNVFLESACFDPRHIRRTSRYHGLQTDASFRFERGADYDITIPALKRAALLIKEISGGEISSDIVDICPTPFNKQVIDLSYSSLDRLAGMLIERELVKEILTSIGMIILNEDLKGLKLEIPSFKTDITREADLIEEILRIFGYNRILFSPDIKSSVSYTPKPDKDKIRNLVSEYLTSIGFYEIMNNSLTRSAYYENEIIFKIADAVKIYNPISRDLDMLRQNLLFGGLETIAYNQNRKISDVNLYEFGTIYRLSNPQDQHGRRETTLSGFMEENHLSFFLTGKSFNENWNSPDRHKDVFDLKGIIHGLLAKTGIGLSLFSVSSVQNDIFNEGLVYNFNRKPIISYGVLTGTVLKKFDCRQEVFYADIIWDDFIALIPVKEKSFIELARFPEVRRDLALLLDESVSFSEVERIAFETEKKLIKKVGLFDVYEGEKIGEGKKSYAVSVILRDDNKTLTDEEIDNVMNKLITAYRQKLNAQIR